MSKIFILYGTSVLLTLAEILLLRNGVKKTDLKTTMRMMNYQPIKNYGKGYSIALGILCINSGVVLLLIKPT